MAISSTPRNTGIPKWTTPTHPPKQKMRSIAVRASCPYSANHPTSQILDHVEKTWSLKTKLFLTPEVITIGDSGNELGFPHEVSRGLLDTAWAPKRQRVHFYQFMPTRRSRPGCSKRQLPTYMPMNVPGFRADGGQLYGFSSLIFRRITTVRGDRI